MLEFIEIKGKEILKLESKNKQLEKQNSDLKKQKSKYQNKISDLSSKLKVKVEFIH